MHGAQTIALAALGDSDTAALLGELLGSHPSVGELGQMIAERAAGNPFFAEEMVRELAQRGVLAGQRGGYICRADVAEVGVPATVQAAIAARIDRLSTPARRTINAASVIGARFGAELLAALGIDAVVDELLSVELIDQVRFTPSPVYAFRHPLIRAVAYESQLKSDRAQVHRRVAAAIESRDPAAAEENAALIAEHLEAAGDLHAAYGWHMRAATWATNRDIARRDWAGSVPKRSPTRYPPMTPTGQPCASPRAPCCAGSPGESMYTLPVPASTNCGSCAPPPGTRRHWPSRMAGLVMDHAYHDPHPRGGGAGIGSLGPHRVARRSDPDGGAVRRGDLRQV